ncbi:MAG: 3-deoxy-D-manno-octulosonic acid transferase, partial [Proteobacteria bacterium]|nr:3-deoxy-D-manno-octulosonic acid transferase [Pseudomonadota bacterium]
MPLGLYRLLSHALRPLVPLLLARRLAVGKEERTRLAERRGFAGLTRPEAPLVWLHAASVGESLSVLPLIEHLLARDPSCHALITTGTVTSARILADRLPPRSAHQYVPVDTPDAVARFLDHWRPDAALWVESELWPNLLVESRRRGIPLALVNARMSQRSFRRWGRLPGLVRPLLTGFAVTLAQSEADGARYTALGARDVRVVGDLKAIAAPLAAEPEALARLQQAIGHRPVWLAASTHGGEEAMAGRVHRILAQQHRDLLTIVVPRHAARGDSIAAELATLGLSVARRGKGAAPRPGDAVFLGDTMGEMGLYLALAPSVFVGKSLLHEGGHNPREPALLGRAVLFGPHMENFAAAAAALQ